MPQAWLHSDSLLELARNRVAERRILAAAVVEAVDVLANYFTHLGRRLVGSELVFMDLLCTRHLAYRCALQYRKLSPAVIQVSLFGMQ